MGTDDDNLGHDDRSLVIKTLCCLASVMEMEWCEVGFCFLCLVKDEHKDWKPLNLEIMRRFTLGVPSSTSNFRHGIWKDVREKKHDPHVLSTTDLCL